MSLLQKPKENSFQIRNAFAHRHFQKANADLPFAHFFNDGWERLFLQRKGELHLIQDPSLNLKNSQLVVKQSQREAVVQKPLQSSQNAAVESLYAAAFDSLLLCVKLLPDP